MMAIDPDLRAWFGTLIRDADPDELGRTLAGIDDPEHRAVLESIGLL